MLIKKMLLCFIMFLAVLFCELNSSVVFAIDFENIIEEQKQFEIYKEEDLSNLVLFSEYDFDYDKKIYYNSAARDIVSNLTEAEKFFQKSNISSSFYKYRKIIKELPQNDFYYMLVAYKLSEIGFFSLSHEAIMKIKDKEIWGLHIDFIRKHCFPKDSLKETEEVFFAGLLSDIVYNNLTEESLTKLSKHGQVLSDYDYSYFIRAKAYFVEKKYKEALYQINKSIAVNSNNIFYQKLKAEILNAMGKEKDCLSVIKKIEDFDIHFSEIKKDLDKIKYHALSKIEKEEIKQKYYLAFYFYLNKDYSRAINELKILIMKGKSSEAPVLLGKIYEITSNFDEAKKLYNKQIEKNKKNAFAHKGLGDIYLFEKKYEDALAEYKLADKYQKNNLETLVAIAVVLKKMNDNKSAQKYGDKLLKVNSKNYKVLYLNSKIRPDKGNLNLKYSISQNPLYSGGWLDLAQQALTLQDIVSAEEYINAAAYITKNNIRYFYYKSILDMEKKDYKSVEIDINRIKQILQEQKREVNEQI